MCIMSMFIFRKWDDGMKRLILCICIFLSLVPVDLWGRNKAGLQPSKLETEVLYDVEGIAYEQVWDKKVP